MSAKVSKLSGVHAVKVKGYPRWLTPHKQTILAMDEGSPLDGGAAITFSLADGSAITVKLDQLQGICYDPHTYLHAPQDTLADETVAGETSGEAETDTPAQTEAPAKSSDAALADFLEGLSPLERLQMFQSKKTGPE